MSEAPTIYHYHPVTGQYLGSGQADPSPLEPGVWLYPAHCTLTAPPDEQAGHVRAWNGSQWLQVPLPEPDPEPEPEPEPEPKDWEGFRVALYSNPDFLAFLESSPLAAKLDDLIWRRQFSPLATTLWQRLKSQGHISEGLEAAIVAAATESNLLDELAIVTKNKGFEAPSF